MKFFIFMIAILSIGCADKQFKITDTHTGISVTVSEDDLKVEIGGSANIGDVVIEAQNAQKESR